MRNLKFKSQFTLVLCSLFSFSIFAQSIDDLYYIPPYDDVSINEKDDSKKVSNEVEEEDLDTINYSVSDTRFDDDYQYQSRLKRFSNPVKGQNYYSPAYTNSYYYDKSPYSWSNNIYTKPFYSQKWWNKTTNFVNALGAIANTFGTVVNIFGNNPNRNYTSTYASFGSTGYNNSHNYNPHNQGSAYNYSTGGFYPTSSYNTPWFSPDYVTNNSIEIHNANRTSTRSNSNVRTVRANRSSASKSNNINEDVRSAPSSTMSDKSAIRTTPNSKTKSYKNNNVRKERKLVVEKSNTYKPKKEKKNVKRNTGTVNKSTKTKTNSGNSRTPPSTRSKSYSTGSSKGSLKSSGTSKRGNRK